MFSGSNTNGPVNKTVDRIDDCPLLIRVRLPPCSKPVVTTSAPHISDCVSEFTVPETSASTRLLDRPQYSKVFYRRPRRLRPLTPAQFINTVSSSTLSGVMDPNTLPFHLFALPTNSSQFIVNKQPKLSNPSVQTQSVSPKVNILFPSSSCYQPMVMNPALSTIHWQPVPQSVTSLGSVMTTSYYTAPRLQSTVLPTPCQPLTSNQQTLRILSTASLNQQALNNSRNCVPSPVDNRYATATSGAGTFSGRPRVLSRMHTYGGSNSVCSQSHRHVTPPTSANPTTATCPSLVSHVSSLITTVVTTEKSLAPVSQNRPTAISRRNASLSMASNQIPRGRPRKNPHPTRIPMGQLSLEASVTSSVPSVSSPKQSGSEGVSFRHRLMKEIQSPSSPSTAVSSSGMEIDCPMTLTGNAVLIPHTQANTTNGIRSNEPGSDVPHNYSCTQCAFTASRLDRVQRHMNRRHSIIGVSPRLVPAQLDTTSSFQGHLYPTLRAVYTTPAPVISTTPAASSANCPQIVSSVSLSPQRRVRVPPSTPPASTSSHNAPYLSLSVDMSFVPQIRNIVSLSPHKAVNLTPMSKLPTTNHVQPTSFHNKVSGISNPIDQNSPNAIPFRGQCLAREGATAPPVEEVYVNLDSPDDQPSQDEQPVVASTAPGLLGSPSPSMIISYGEVHGVAVDVQHQHARSLTRPNLDQQMNVEDPAQPVSSAPVVVNRTLSNSPPVLAVPTSQLQENPASIPLSPAHLVEMEQPDVETVCMSNASPSPRHGWVFESDSQEATQCVYRIVREGDIWVTEQPLNTIVDNADKRHEQTSGIGLDTACAAEPPSTPVPKSTHQQLEHADGSPDVSQCGHINHESSDQAISRLNTSSSSAVDSIVSDEDDDLVFVGFDLAGKAANKRLFCSGNCKPEYACTRCSGRPPVMETLKSSSSQPERRSHIVLKHSGSTCDSPNTIIPYSPKPCKMAKHEVTGSLVPNLVTTEPETGVMRSHSRATSPINFEYKQLTESNQLPGVSVTLVPLTSELACQKPGPHSEPGQNSPSETHSQKTRRRRKSPLRPVSTGSSDIVWEKRADPVCQPTDAFPSGPIPREDVVDLTVDSDSDHAGSVVNYEGKTSTPVKSTAQLPTLLLEKLMVSPGSGETILPVKSVQQQSSDISRTPNEQPEPSKDPVEDKDPRFRILVDRFTGEIFVDDRPLRELVPGIKPQTNRARMQSINTIPPHTKPPLKGRPIVERKRRKRNKLSTDKSKQNKTATRGRPKRVAVLRVSDRRCDSPAVTKSLAPPVSGFEHLPLVILSGPNPEGITCPSMTTPSLCAPTFVSHTQDVII